MIKKQKTPVANKNYMSIAVAVVHEQQFPVFALVV